MMQQQREPRVFIVTGVAGSGRATAMRVLEDLGFYCIDNLPVALIPRALELTLEARNSDLRGVGLGIDARDRLFFPQWPRIFAELEAQGRHLEVIFLDAADEVLMRRYSESRRPHPLAVSGVSLLQSIRRERLALAELRERASRVIETSTLTVHELRETIVNIVLGAERGLPMAVDVVSFGFKYGPPIGLDIVQDVRFIPNPFFVDELRPLSGIDPRVRAFVLEQPAAGAFLSRFEELLKTLMPLYQREGRSYLSIGLGCTGGRHRSPALAVEVAAILEGLGYKPNVRHQHMALGT
jgi:UPF0042 nucleotide-binding protein